MRRACRPRRKIRVKPWLRLRGGRAEEIEVDGVVEGVEVGEVALEERRGGLKDGGINESGIEFKNEVWGVERAFKGVGALSGECLGGDAEEIGDKVSGASEIVDWDDDPAVCGDRVEGAVVQGGPQMDFAGERGEVKGLEDEGFGWVVLRGLGAILPCIEGLPMRGSGAGGEVIP